MIPMCYGLHFNWGFDKVISAWGRRVSAFAFIRVLPPTTPPSSLNPLVKPHQDQ